MKKIFALYVLCASLLYSTAQSVVIPNVWINEIHYDDLGTDGNEGFEVAGTAGTNLHCFEVWLYTGPTPASAVSYDTITLSGTLPAQYCGIGTAWFGLPVNGIENGPNDGLALVYAPQHSGCGVNNVDTVLQFLSYEGIITAADGRAAGLTSTDIGVAETVNTPDSVSIQLVGFGTTYSSFTWEAGLDTSHADVNTNQTFCPPSPVVQFAVSSQLVMESAGTFTVSVTIANPNANPTTVAVNVSGGTATSGTDFTTSPSLLTFPANSFGPQQISFNIISDNLDEPNETVFITLSNPTNGASIGAVSADTLSIIDDDALFLLVYPPTQSQFENIGTINVPVLLNNPSVNPTSVTVKLVSSTAAQGTDYYFADTTITWPAGTSGTRQVPVTIVDDNLFEADETIAIKITNPTNGAQLADSTFDITIRNNDNLSGSDCTDLYFSEYIEGTSNNKALEIYNPTNSAVNLSDYKIVRFNNGSTSGVEFQLSGFLAAEDVYVLVNATADSLLKLKADTLTGYVNHNGDDAYALLHISDTIDVLGVIGVDPGNSWVVDTATTEDHTLIRSYYYYIGSKDWSAAVQSWKSYSVDLIDSLGFHNTAECGNPEPISPAVIRFVKILDTVPEIYTPNFNYFDVVVQCINPSGQNATFSVALDAGASTATQGLTNDFIYTNQNITAGAGVTFDTVSFIINNDNLIEPTENALLRFINLSANTVVGPDSIYNLYITDSDVLTVSFLGASYDYTEDAGLVQVKVTLSTPVANNTSATIQLAAGSATRNVDFTFNDTTLVFLANTADTLAFFVDIIEDGLDEGNEEINFDLINPTNGAALGTIGCTVRIIDNDSTVGFEENQFDNSLQVYPNPVSDLLFLKSEKLMDEFFVTDITGKAVGRFFEVHSTEYALDVSQFAEGIYYIMIHSDGQRWMRRFVKRN
ncbi:MAG: lamin tail domain-containing protein [Bacteroidetes bacterium]|nr:lamin tail domain-containing protein [Bacteroidota bacterium]